MKACLFTFECIINDSFCLYCSVIAGASSLHPSTATGSNCSAMKKGDSFSFNIGLNDCGTMIKVGVLWNTCTYQSSAELGQVAFR